MSNEDKAFVRSVPEEQDRGIGVENAYYWVHLTSESDRFGE